MKKLFEGRSKWIALNNGIIPSGGESLVLTCSKDGELSFSVTEELEYKGKWWVSRDRFYFKISGSKSYFCIVKEGNSIKFFDATGTLYAKFNPYTR